MMEDEQELKTYVMTEQKYTDLFWKYFEFMELLKTEIRKLPKIRSKPAEDLEVEKMGKVDFYQQH